MPKIIKKKEQKDLIEARRQFGVVLEDINSKVSLVLEGHNALDKKIDIFKEEFVEFKEETNIKFKIIGKSIGVMGEDISVLKQDVGVLKQDVGVLKQDVGVLKQDVGVLKQDVGVLKQDVGVLKNDMVIVKSKLTSIENQLKQKVDINQFEQLEQRVIRLEKIAMR